MGADVLDPAAAGGLSGGTGRRAPREVLAPPSAADGGEEALAGAVLSWWADARAARDRLPWRATRDPWAILVSETMLVQTQALRVAARFPEVLDRFPTPAALADATTAEVLAWWTGLGYNRRALWLQRAARRIVDRHEGAVPDDLDDLKALPGVGPYTARAVLAFAFGRPVGVVDTNVGRVLARAVAGRRLSLAEAQSRADRLVPPARAREWNLALMDLGALCCRARRPDCPGCPLGDGPCAWRRSGDAEDPGRGSAGTGRAQARFVGSDRQGRGRLVRAALAGPIPAGALAETAGWPDDPVRAARVASGLVAEGLLAGDGAGGLRLP